MTEEALVLDADPGVARPRVAAQRAMLRAREAEPRARFHGQQGEQRYGEGETEYGGNAQVDGHRFYLASLAVK